MARHLLLVANTPVRNAGTWAGNLMIKYHHREFPSDVFLLLAAAKAKLKIADENGVEDMDVEKMYGTCMKNKIIVSMALPPLDENKFIFKTYKVTPRAISSHAYVNAAFVLPLDPATTEVTERPCLLFGGISGTFAHAAATEHYLTGRRLAEPTTLKAALQTLLDEVQPQPDPELADVVYRRRLAASLLYKAVLHALGERVPARLRSGAEQLTRPGLSGRQQFDTDPALWPVSQAVPKLEAQVQTSGEAEFVDDQPTVPGELYGYYVLSTVGDAQLKVVDGSAALAVKGVHGFVTAKDFIGSNELFTCAMLLKGMGMDTDLLTPELVFADGTVRFCGQPIGLVVADTRELARHAAALVRVEYAQVAPPVVTIRQALKKQPQGMQQSPICPANVTTGDPDGALQAAPRCVSGVWEMGGQDAFAMEAHVARAVPCEDGQLNMSCATQGVKEVVNGVADCVCVPANKINLEVRRLGGGFGGKLSNAVPIACAAALAAIKLNRPVRIVLDVETSMAMCSSRFPHYISYQVGFDDAGRVHGLKLNTVANDGYCITVNSFVEIQQLVAGVQNVYRTDNWSVIPGSVSTNLPPHTAIRGPGMVNGIAAIEMVMDHIAHELRMDPWEVRKANFFAADSQVPRPFDDKQDHEVFARMVEEMFDSGDIVKRQAEIQAFNKANRWRKRALALVPMRYPMALWTKMPAMVSVYDQDGSVAVTCGGVEMGQGLNTKVAQVCALELGVPLHQVSVKPNSSLANPNGIGTGGSISSETSSMAARSACRQLLQRLQPFRAASGQPALSWLQLVQTASQAGVNLTAHAIQSPPAGAPPDMYTVWGLTAVEAELDVLTGESLLHRADVMEDAGQPLSPAVDVGQVEGAFAYGVGLMMTERYRFHPETGRRLTNRAWNYYVPTHKDMPRDFRVKLLKNNRNPVGIFNSKATGEPAVCMSVACLLALRQAVAEARREASLHAWFQFDSPATPERTQMACDVGVEELVLA
ncbi:xanthine dehydrogenase-like [Pollicipes pollicipes]|uniref:xanthine dehydrogenase-like n=2 Tax=Pollicipes pollicipes TaxID=41117 RepID=UPI0018850AD5|nr:xanthine dehydrogenase-like [Pollicipes pollicipes]